MSIKAIVGLGNPGKKFLFNRHNIGFMVVDYLAAQAQAQWHTQENLEHTTITVDDKNIILIKPQTFMNNSGAIVPWLSQKNIKPEDVLVVHDELEFPFGKVSHKCGGSARGHNGLRSLISHMGPEFCRIRCGIDRPERKEEVAQYVLSNFTQDEQDVQKMIEVAAIIIISQAKL